MDTVNATGRRKGAVARVYVRNGSGKVEVNGRKLEEYFPTVLVRNTVLEPMAVVDQAKTYDVKVVVSGGGFKGQSEAIRLGISRALVKINEDFKPPLKDRKFLTRDSRVVERKKFGKPKARKSFQFSKR